MHKITSRRARARGHVFDEAAEHLGMDFTDDPIELAEVEYCIRKIKALADYWFRRSSEAKDD